MTQLERDIQTIYSFLVQQQTHHGTSKEMAAHLGMTCHRMTAALTRVRSAEFIDEHGWTIPNVRKGRAPKTWAVVRAGEHFPVLKTGLKVRVPEIHEIVRRARASAVLGCGAGDARDAKYAKYVVDTLVHLEDTGSMLMEAMN